MIWRDARLLLDTLRLGGEWEPSAARDAWSRADGRVVAATIVWEGGALWLLRRLAEAGLEEAAPAPLVAALRTTAIGEKARGMLVDAATEELLRYLSARAFPHVLIKGTARRAATACYPFADARATRDVDVLLPEPCAQQAWEDLRTSGWPLLGGPTTTRRAHYHLPVLLAPQGVGVELHCSVGHNYTAAEAWQRVDGEAVELEWHQLRVRVPSATELLWHGLTHALRADLAGFRLRYFLDGSSVLASGAAIAWDRIVARLARGEAGDAAVARKWLRAAAILAGCNLPASVSGASTDFDVVRSLAWRLAVLTRGGNAGFTGRLLEEGTRLELGFAVAPVVDGTGPFRQARRWLAGRAARLLYRAWRAAARGDPTPRSGLGGP